MENEDVLLIKKEARRAAEEVAKGADRAQHAQPKFPILLLLSLIIGRGSKKRISLSFTNLDVAKAWRKGSFVPI